MMSSESTRLVPISFEEGVGVCRTLEGRIVSDVSWTPPDDRLLLQFGAVDDETLLWTWCAEWRVERDGRIVSGSGEDYPAAPPRALLGRRLDSLVISKPALGAALEFDGGVRLVLFPTCAADLAAWWCETTTRRIAAGPGQQFHAQIPIES